ncbi:hypothetical protein COB57_04860 [Candidatus Peregrinibacteria bacterium]|nr:MAG: hypothetical protein COB57_04860 [Candidatus Peregrinibacteria bacterium]
MKYNYIFTVNCDTDGYIAYVPAFDITVVDDNIGDLITAIETAIETCIRVYKEEGVSIPDEDKEFVLSGKIALRVPRSLHKKIIMRARCEGVSMNQYIVSRLSGKE